MSEPSEMIFLALDWLIGPVAVCALLLGFGMMAVGAASFAVSFTRFRERRPIWANGRSSLVLGAPFVACLAIAWGCHQVLLSHQRAALVDIVERPFQVSAAPGCVVDRPALASELTRFRGRFPDHSGRTSGPRVTVRSGARSMEVTLSRDDADPQLYWLEGATYATPIHIGVFRSTHLGACA